MISKQFKDLIKISEDYILAAKRKKINFNEILSGLYTDPSHFIYELIQNAEDTGATEIIFNLFDERFEMIHNGRNFNFDDIESITGIGLSTKKDLNKIGKFGVGFKSVFAVTKKPIIESGQFHFSIDNFVLPNALEVREIKNTKITLPFNHPNRKSNEVFKLVENKLQNIGLKTLLFLTNIKEIKWETPFHNGHYYKSNKVINTVKSTKKVSIISQTDNVEHFEEYLALSKPIIVADKELSVEIAYKLETNDNEKEQISPISDQESKLVVYFPTEKITYLNFIIQGPFKTTPNRENIPIADKQNEIIINEISSLVADSLPIIRNLGYLSTSFLEVLPIRKENCDEPLYSSIYNSVKKKLLSNEKLLPTNHKGFSHPNDSILARGKILTKLLKSKDINILFQKSHWLNTDITYDRTRELRDYLINELGIDEINFEDFCENITEKFMKSKNDDWIVQFYVELTNSIRDTLFRKRTRFHGEGALFRKPIIRLKNNKHCSIYDKNGKIQVYLPTKTKSSYKIIKPSLAKRKRASAFLKKRNVSEPDIFAEIHEHILPKYKIENLEIIDDEYFEDIEKILLAFAKTKSSDKINELIEDLKELRIIKAINPETNENCLMQPSKVYLNTDDLRLYFEAYDGAYFIIKKLYQKFDKNLFEEFALKIGCNRYPKRIVFEGNLSWSERNNICNKSGYCYHNTIYIKDFKIDGLNNFLKKLTALKSTLLWKYILQSISNLSKIEQERYFLGDYCWTPRSNRFHKYFDSKFKNQLCAEKWLFDKDNNQVCPSEISILDLADNYFTEDENVTVLERILGFQLDKIKQIEKETGGKFLNAEETKEYEKLLAEKKAKEEIELYKNEKWVEDISPDEVETTISEGTIEPLVSDDLTYQKTKSGDDEDEGENVVDDNGIPPKKIGNWGEKFVFNYFEKNRFSELKDVTITDFGFSGKNSLNKIIELKWLNRNKDIGKGYDFVIIENGVEIEYIEVKATIKSEKTLHIITGTQWEFARRLFNSGDGEKYKIYAVKNANSRNAKIKFISNPIRLWKDGNLYAHPINFKV